MDDCDAWIEYPEYRWVFNKLDLSLRLNYNAGPAGVAVSTPGEYIVRPIYNLSGMGVGAEIKYLDIDDYNLPAGHFWCERFHGNHITINWKKEQGTFVPAETAIGFREYGVPLYKFSKWKLLDNIPSEIRLPDFVNDIKIEKINTEFIGDKLIEIHLRWGIDFPEGASELIPVWKDEKENFQMLSEHGWKFCKNYEDADSQLSNPRLGFYYR
jgi:hypothetical protein